MKVCSFCQAKLAPDMSRCKACGKWNMTRDVQTASRRVLLSDVTALTIPRYLTGPWDVCFGGGIVPTSVSLLAGEPGAGKSTILLHIADQVAGQRPDVLYIATEEGESQIKDRADRLQLQNMHQIVLANGMGQDLELPALLRELRPTLVILDSLPGFTGRNDRDESIEVVRLLKNYAVANESPVIVTDHVTKELDYAGYMALLHAVDCLLMLDRKRVLTVEKNRNGPAPLSLYMKMTAKGLIVSSRAETSSPPCAPSSERADQNDD